jgi:CheY-like chemotaxis protein
MIRLVIADDQALVRAGLRGLLELAGDFAVVAEAADGAQAIELTERLRPDLLLLDVRMPAASGIEVLRELRRLAALPPTLLLTTFDDDEALLEGMRAGARGFMLKDVTPERLCGNRPCARHRRGHDQEPRLEPAFESGPARPHARCAQGHAGGLPVIAKPPRAPDGGASRRPDIGVGYRSADRRTWLTRFGRRAMPFARTSCIGARAIGLLAIALAAAGCATPLPAGPLEHRLAGAGNPSWRSRAGWATDWGFGPRFNRARLYPDEVAGIVLVEPTHPRHWTRLQQEAPRWRWWCARRGWQPSHRRCAASSMIGKVAWIASSRCRLRACRRTCSCAGTSCRRRRGRSSA